MFLVDSHCHLDALNYDSLHPDLDSVMHNAAARGVKHVLAVGTTVESSYKMLEMVGERSDVSFSCGIHPLELGDKPNVAALRDLAIKSRVVALGETGLDYYYQKDNHPLQQQVFRDHIRLACEVQKPVIVHTRDARQDTLDILRDEHADRCGGVLHCFTEDLDTARQLLDIGFYISFSGIVTFRNADRLRDVARYVPLERMLIETDSPYLAPVPHRGKENQPANVRDIADYLSVLKGIGSEQLADITTANFNRLFQLSI